MQAVQQPKSVMIDPNYSNRKNQKRIEDDEKELEELMKAASGESSEEEAEEQEEEEQVEDNEADKGETEEEDSKLSKEEATFKKRYGDLRRYQQEQEAKYKAKIEELENGEVAGIAPPKSNEDIEAWAKKYPDIAGIVETIATNKAKQMFEQADSRFKELDTLQYETKRTQAETAIRSVHSDFDKLKASDEFHDWVDEQPKWIKDALYDNEDDAQAVIRVIDLYKVDKKMTPADKKQKAKEAASDVKSKSTAPKLDADMSGKKFTESQVSKMTDAEFAEHYDKIMEAQRTGNFVYDMKK